MKRQVSDGGAVVSIRSSPAAGNSNGRRSLGTMTMVSSTM